MSFTLLEWVAVAVVIVAIVCAIQKVREGRVHRDFRRAQRNARDRARALASSAVRRGCEVEILGVYPADAPQSCHMIEVKLRGFDDPPDFGEFTQQDPAQPPPNWQVAWDEEMIGETGKESHWIFYLHYVQFNRPLWTPVGPMELPSPTSVPAHLEDFKYLPP